MNEEDKRDFPVKVHTIRIYEGYKAKRILSELLTILFPFDIKYSPDDVIKEYTCWAIDKAFEESKNNRKTSRDTLKQTINKMEGLQLQNFICNIVLSGEDMPLIPTDYRSRGGNKVWGVEGELIKKIETDKKNKEYYEK